MSTAQRNTKQRQVILEEVRKVYTHPTADEVYQTVRKILPNISLGTVYRNLEVLSEQGRLLKLEFGRSQKRFDGNVDNHYHIRCIECGKLEDVSHDANEMVDNILQKTTKFEVLGHNLEYYGLCPSCKNGN